MTTITVPRETWDAMREALKLCYEHCRVYHPEVDTNNVGQSVRQALTAANAVSHPKTETAPVTEGGAITSESARAMVDEMDMNDRVLAAIDAEPQAQGEARSLTLAKQQWESWKKYALELQERLVKYEGGAPMVLNASHPQATEPAGYKLVPVELTPEMMRAIQLKSAIGAEIAANWTGAYESFQELYSIAIAAAPEAKQ